MTPKTAAQQNRATFCARERLAFWSAGPCASGSVWHAVKRCGIQKCPPKLGLEWSAGRFPASYKVHTVFGFNACVPCEKRAVNSSKKKKLRRDGSPDQLRKNIRKARNVSKKNANVQPCNGQRCSRRGGDNVTTVKCD